MIGDVQVIRRARGVGGAQACGLTVAATGVVLLILFVVLRDAAALPSPVLAALLLVGGGGLFAAAQDRFGAAAVALGSAVVAGALANGAAQQATSGGVVTPWPFAFALVLAGVSVMFAGRRPTVAWAAALVLCVLVVCDACAWAVGLRPSEQAASSVTPETSLAVAVLAAGLLALHPGRAPARWLAGETAGARLARRLVPVVVLLPLFLALALLRWGAASTLSPQVGALVAAAVLIAVITFTIAAAARELDRAERRTREQARQFRLLAEALPVGVVQRDESGRAIYANEQSRAILGLGRDADVATLTPELFHPEDRDELVARMQHTLNTGEPYELELRVRRDGYDRWVAVRAVRQIDEHGAFAGYVATLQDIHDRRVAQQALAASEELHRLTIASIPGAVVGLYDRELRCLLIQGNSSTTLTTETCRGKRLAEFAGDQVAGDLEPPMRRALRGEHSRLDYEAPSGSVLRFEIAPFHGPQGEIEGAVIVSTDITEQRRAEDAERQATEQLHVAFEQAPIGYVIVSIDGVFEKVNPALCQITGYTKPQLKAMPPFAIVDPQDLQDVTSRFSELGAPHDTIELEHRIIHATGASRWVEARVTLVRDSDGQPLHALAQIQDITERRQALAQLRYIADHDALTGIRGRRSFEDHLERLTRRVARGEEPPAALLLIDLNGFKAVNDTLGHSAGDDILTRVAAALQDTVRVDDVVARLGGDEFAVLLPRTGAAGARRVSENLAQAVARHGTATSAGHTASVTAAIGACILDQQRALTPQEALREADAAMYRDKAASRTLTDPARLQAVHATGMLDLPTTDPELQRLTDTLADSLDVPIALISLLTDRRQHFLAQTGLDDDLAARGWEDAENSYCQYPAARGRPLIVPDTHDHALLGNHVATTDKGLRAYAGIPIQLDGQVIGVVCAATTEPRRWQAQELAALQMTAAHATRYLQHAAPTTSPSRGRGKSS